MGGPFVIDAYKNAYGALSSDKLKIRRGIEFGLTPWDKDELTALTEKYDFDFVLGSVHYVKGHDPYLPEYWCGKTVDQAFEEYVLKVLECVKAGVGFDVLGHINYVCKSPNNSTHTPLHYDMFSDIFDEIMKTMGENPKVRIIRMRKVPFIDSTGLHNLETLCLASRKNGIHIVLSGVKPQVYKTLEKAGFTNLLGKENICSNINIALEQAIVLNEK